MIVVKENLKDVKDYIVNDYRSSKFRFGLEVFAWACSIATSITFAVTIPNIPIVPLYFVFITGCTAALYCAWTRGSFGLMLNYLFLIVIDAFGLGRYLIGTL
jgi:hypothetical protein